MKSKSYEKTIEELDEEIIKESRRYDAINEKISIIKDNCYEESGFIFYGLSGFIQMFMSIILFYKGSTIYPFLNSFIPTDIIPISLIGLSLGIGKIASSFINKKIKRTTKFNKISKSKREIDKQEEIARLNIEYEKSRDKIIILNTIFNQIEHNHKNLDELETIYDKNNMNIPQSYEDTKNKIEEIKNELNTKYQALDIIAKRYALNNQFYDYRPTIDYHYEKFIEFIRGFLFSYLLLMLFGVTGITKHLTFSPLADSIYTSLIVTLPIVSGILNSNTVVKTKRKVFKKLNNELGEDKLSNRPNKNKEIEKKHILENRYTLIEEIEDLEIKLIEQKRILDIFESNDTNINSKEQDKRYIPLMENTYNEEVTDKGNQYVLRIK